MKYCSSCGKPIPKDALFCPQCSHPLVKEENITATVNIPTGPKLTPGMILGERYRLVQVAGRGGMGIIYLASDLELNREVAIKVLPEALVGDELMEVSLKHEANLCLELTHPNIVRLYDFKKLEGLYCLVMEYVSGGSLANVLARNREGIPEEEVVRYLFQTCRGLAHAHYKKVLHRDLKPGNILLGGDGEAKVADFGIARVAHDSYTRVTKKSISGTPAYMSPEQLRGKRCDVRSDIYSLGCTFYQLLSGDIPFSTGDITYQHLHEPPEKIERISGWLWAILDQMLAKDPADRFENIPALMASLEACCRKSMPGVILDETGGGKSFTPLPTGPEEDETVATPLTPRQPYYSEEPPSGAPPGDPPGDPPSSGGVDLPPTPLPGSGPRKLFSVLAVFAVVILAGYLFLRPSPEEGQEKTAETSHVAPLEQTASKKTAGGEEGKIVELLSRGREFESYGALLDPKGENAAEIYRQVLRLDADNGEARSGLERIRDLFISRGDVILGRDDFKGAEESYREALRAMPLDTLVLSRLEDVRLSKLKKNRGKKSQKEEEKASLKAPERQKAEDIRLAGEKAEASRKKEEERIAKEKADTLRKKEEERVAKEKADVLRKKEEELAAREKDRLRLEAMRRAEEKVNQEALRKEKEDKERVAKEKAEKAAAKKASTGNASLLDMQFVRVPGGQFVMGSNKGPADAKPEHTVTVSSFFLGKYEVTQSQWLQVMKKNPSAFSTCGNCPVENVSWNDVGKFLKTAAELTGLNLRLPTEAEWEYAARGGLGQKWAGTNSEKAVPEYAWYADNSNSRTHPVGGKKPNPFGLYDLSGNVWEWCADLYDKKYYRISPLKDPPGPSKGSRRVLRGGSWRNTSSHVSTIRRTWDDPFFTQKVHGFRVAHDGSGGSK